MNVLFQFQMNKVLGKIGHCKHIHGGYLHLGKGADNGIPKIRNVMNIVIILAQNILYKLQPGFLLVANHRTKNHFFILFY